MPAAKKGKGTGRGRSAMLGGAGRDGTSRAFIKEIMTEIGGPKAVAEHITKHLKNPEANPYLQSRSVGNVMKLLLLSGDDEAEEEIVGDDELETIVMKDTIRFFVTMPDDVFTPLFARILERRAELAAASESAKQALTAQQRAADAPYPTAG